MKVSPFLCVPVVFGLVPWALAAPLVFLDAGRQNAIIENSPKTKPDLR
jgi:hypothetical protein